MTRSDYWLDASSNNGPINIAAYAAAGHTHIALKGTEGTGYAWFDGNAYHDLAHGHGLTVDRYAWLRPDQGNAKMQAAHFVETVKDHMKMGDGWFPDYERSTDYSTGRPVADPPDAVWAQFLLDFAREVERLMPGYQRRLYTGNWYLEGKPHMIAAVRQFDVILSEYDGEPGLSNPHGFNVVAKQFTDRATIAGVGKPSDYNIWLKKPTTAPKEFTMDAEAKAAFAAVNAKLDFIESRFIGTDGKSHTNESTVAHVTQGAKYLGGKGHFFTRLFRLGDKLPQ